MSKATDVLNHLINKHGFLYDQLSGKRENDFDFLMQIHENHHDLATNLRHCGLFNKKKDGPCEEKAIVRLTFSDNKQIDICNAHTLNIAKEYVRRGNDWSNLGIERINQ